MKKLKMPSVKALLNAYKVGAAVLALLTAIFGALSFVTSMTENGRYFVSSVSVTLLYISLALTIIFAFSSVIAFEKNFIISTPFKWIRFTYLLPAVCIASIIVNLFKKLSANSTDEQNRIIEILLVVSAFASLFYLLSIVINFSKTVTAGFGYVFILFCILAIAKFHTDHSLEMNSPFKIIMQFTAAATALSILSDIRTCIGRPGPSQYLISKICSITLSVLCVVSSAIVYSRGFSTDYIIYAILFLACAICSATELFTSTISEYQIEEELDDIEIPADETENTSTSTDSDPTANNDAE